LQPPDGKNRISPSNGGPYQEKRLFTDCRIFVPEEFRAIPIIAERKDVNAKKRIFPVCDGWN
jgi:hypothetical protein